MSTLATLTTVFDSDVTGFKKGVAETGKGADSIATKMSAAGKKATLFMTTPLLGAGVAAFKAASDLDESMTKVSVVFGNNAKDIQDWASNAATSMGQSKQEALEAAGTLGNLFRAIGLGTPQAAEMSKTMVGLAGDLASFNNASPEEAMTALRSGLVGETEPLKRFGINLNEARLKEEALRQGLIKTAKGTLPANIKAQAAYALILKDSKLAQGDFARTAGGAANQQRILTAKLKDAAAMIGTKLLPIGTKLLTWVSGLLSGFQSIPEPIQTLIVVLGGIAAAVGPVLVVGAKLINSFKTVSQAFGFLSKIMSVNPYVLIIAATVALVILIVKNWDTIKKALAAAWNWIKSTAATIWNAILGFFKRWWPLLLTVFLGPIGAITALVIKNWTTIKNTSVAVWNAIKSAISAVWNGIKKAAQVVWGGLVAIFRGYVNTYKTIILGTFNTIKAVLSGIWNGITGAVRSAWNTITGIIRGAINRIMGPINGLKRAVSWIIPGSPVPFVVGVDASAKALQRFQRQVNRMDFPSPMTVGAGVRTAQPVAMGGASAASSPELLNELRGLRKDVRELELQVNLNGKKVNEELKKEDKFKRRGSG